MVKKDLMAFVAKVEDGKKFIRISDFYESNYTGEEFVAVSDDVLESLVAMKREEKRMAENDYRYLAAFGYDDAAIAEIEGKFVSSPEDTFLIEVEAERAREALAVLSPDIRRRIYMYFYDGMTTRQIAKAEGVSHNAVAKSIRIALKVLKKQLCKTDIF